jgi:spore maturation protein CgeB
MDKTRVLLTGGTSDRLNSNLAIRQHIATGFREVVGDSMVHEVELERAAEIIRKTFPEIVLVCGSCLSDQSCFWQLRDACQRVGCPLVFWIHEDPYEFDASARFIELADFVFSNDRWSSLHYHRANVFHLPLGACPETHGPDRAAIASEAKVRDVFFCGVGYPVRRRIIDDLASVLEQVSTEIYGDQWDVDKHPFCHNRRLPNDSLPLYYASSHVVLNIGRDLNLANCKYLLAPSTPGPRTFEAAMAGACQMMFADSLEVLEYFEKDKEIVLFDDPEHFRSLLKNLLSEPARCATIGAAARTRCLKEHTYAIRVRKLLGRVGLPAMGKKICSVSETHSLANGGSRARAESEGEIAA